MPKPAGRWKSGLGRTGLIVLSAACTFGGLLGLYRGVEFISLYARARSWQQCEATVRRVALTRSRNSSNVVGEYTYTYRGRPYTGSRIGITRFGDNIGPWQLDTYHRLQVAERSGEPVPCFVDPDHPESALLDRSFRPALVSFYLGLGGVFTFFWGLVLYCLLLKDRSASRNPQAAPDASAEESHGVRADHPTSVGPTVAPRASGRLGRSGRECR